MGIPWLSSPRLYDESHYFSDRREPTVPLIPQLLPVASFGSKKGCCVDSLENNELRNADSNKSTAWLDKSREIAEQNRD